jgi:pyruvate dehydrogenase E2 component (dihydrolipoamide acetyltransferase)
VKSDYGFVSPVFETADVDSEEWAENVIEVLSSARSNKIPLAHLSGATTAITDLGEFGIRQANTLLFPPQTSGFNIGVVRQKKDKCKVDFTLVVDHRIADPGDAASVVKTFEKKLNEVLSGNG